MRMVLGGVVIAAVLGFIAMKVIAESRPTTHRLPFPKSSPLTEAAAIDLTKQALTLAGKATPTMRPVPHGRNDGTGDGPCFFRNADGESGWAMWWLDRPGFTWEYGVGIRRDGEFVECTITKPN